MYLGALFAIIAMVAQAIILLLIVQFVISLLFAFNVVSGRNDLLQQIYRSINMLLDPLLSPLRRILPNTGAIDFSPLILLLLLNALIIVLGSAT